MKIYHGTTAAVAKRALAEGLKPRNATGKSNWKHSVESNPSLIYLTTTYAPYYALQGAQTRKDEKIAIIEIETDLLDETKMRPDEDFIEQVTSRDKKNSAGIVGDTMNERTAYIRNHIDEFDRSWKLSVEHLGNCGYKGVIKDAITKVAVVDVTKCRSMCLEATDPTITLINYQVCGKQYRLLNQWFMGEPVTVEEWFQNQSVNPLPFLSDQQKASAIRKMSARLANQSCIEIIFPKVNNLGR